MLQAKDATRIVVSGRTVSDNIIHSDIATCLPEGLELSCTAKSFEDTSFMAGSYVPFADKMIFVGAKQSIYSSIAIVDVTSGTALSYVYTSKVMSSVSLLKVQSPPGFIGGFVAGTCMSLAGVNYIYAGMVRTDTGIMTGIYLAPMRGGILNNAELVNTMALEYQNPDSFIAGGLQLHDGAGMQAYLVCVNSIYRQVIYGMRYVLRDTANSNRRGLLEHHFLSSAVKGMLRVEETLYVLVNLKQSEDSLPINTVSVLKINQVSGRIAQQVHINSNNASIQCSDITAAGLNLIIACATQYHLSNATQAVVLSVNRDLAFSKLPTGFIRLENATFEAEPFAFKGTVLPLTMSIDEKMPTEYSFNTADGYPTVNPSVAPTILPSSQPSSAPSGRPSSSPTAAPSVSPQPSSQPSTSGPTNTYKPTAKPTQRPTVRPSVHPTPRPSQKPSLSPTARPSAPPSTRPSNSPSATPSSTRPTNTPSVKPTRQPSVLRTNPPSRVPTTTPTVLGTNQKEQKRYKARESAILGYTVAGLLGFLFLYQLCRWCLYKVSKVKEDKKRVKEMVAQDLPGKPRYPLFSAVASLCCAMDAADEAVEEPVEVRKSGGVVKAAAETTNHAYAGQGAFVDSPHFVDLESNMPDRNKIGSDTIGNGCQKTGDVTGNKKEALPVEAPRETLTSVAIVNSGTDTDERTEIPVENTLQVEKEMCEVSDISDESADESETSSRSAEDIEVATEEEVEVENHSFSVSARGSEDSYVTGDSEEYEPSDDGDVVYTISSEEDDESNDNVM